MGQLGYPISVTHVRHQLSGDGQLIYVSDYDGTANGFIALHFIQQLGLTGDIALITYLVNDEAQRSSGIGSALLTAAIAAARQRKCDRIQLHCSLHCEKAHRFYERMGFIESPKYFTMSLTDQ